MKRKRELIDDILDPNYNFEDIDYDHDPDAHYSDNDIKTKCLKCGFEENVPDFIYDEFAKKKSPKSEKNPVTESHNPTVITSFQDSKSSLRNAQ